MMRMLNSAEQAHQANIVNYPTNPFTILELQNPSHDVPELHKVPRSPDVEARKL